MSELMNKQAKNLLDAILGMATKKPSDMSFKELSDSLFTDLTTGVTPEDLKYAEQCGDELRKRLWNNRGEIVAILENVRDKDYALRIDRLLTELNGNNEMGEESNE